MAKAYCVENDLELATSQEYVFFDKGQSAYEGRHLGDEGQLRRFLNLVEDGTIEKGSFLIVESLDRLSRQSVRVALPRFMDLLNKGINIVTLADRQTYSASSSNLDMELIFSMMIMVRAHEESKTKGMRVSQAWANKKSLARIEKKPLSRHCPHWIELKDGEYKLIPERVEVVKTIFELTIKGSGQAVVARTLNQRQIPVFGGLARNKSGAWGTSSVNKLIGNRALLGEYQPTLRVDGVRKPDGDPVFDFFPPALSEEVFYQAQAARAERRISGASKQSQTFNVWQGIARCYTCGDAMHLINKGRAPKGYTYLQCHSAKKGVCVNRMIRVERSERVFKEVLAKVGSLSLVNGTSNDIRDKLAVMDGRVLDLASTFKEASKSYKSFPSHEAGRVLQEIELELDSLKLQQETLKQQLASDNVISKEDFFNKLDLVTVDGRHSANSLLKRYGIFCFFECKNPVSAQFTVSSSNVLPYEAKNYFQDVLFWISYIGEELVFQAASEEIWAKQVLQGELTDYEAKYELDEGISAHWFGGRLRRK